MAKLDQSKAPYVEAVKKYVKEGISPFDVPGHHMGNINNEFTKLVGKEVYQCDVNAPIGLDNLAHPSGVILESEQLLADAMGADDAFFLINGTSSGLIAAILTVCRPNDRIILPRNVHKSITSALILSGAVPEYIMPNIDVQLEIANQPTVEDYKKCILRYPSAKAVFIINPTYFGAITDIKAITIFAHAHHMTVIVDEAHGAHYYFSPQGPFSAMEANADVAAVSFHKTGGSLTQSSVLLIKGNRVTRPEIQRTLNMINTTSPSSLLICSIDAARQQMAMKGPKEIKRVCDLSKYALLRLSKVPGFIMRGKTYFKQKGCFDYDKTKLVIELDHIDLSGFEVFKLLKEKYHIQLELAETYVLLGILAIGTKKAHIDNLVSALKDISKDHYKKKIDYPSHRFDLAFPYAVTRPRSAFHAPAKKVKIEDALYEISKESVIMYPPGIPLIIPGEVFSKDIINRIFDAKESGALIISDYTDGTLNVIDRDKWSKNDLIKKKLKDYMENRKTSPRNDGYRFPFEGDKHQKTFILLPFRKDVWRNGGENARKEFKQLILSIARFEEVVVGIHPKIYDKVISQFENMPNITPIKVKYDDAWARDNMPLFLTNGNKLRTIDFRFNAWGGSFDGLYTNYENDDALGKVMSKYLKLDSYYFSNFVLEGGSIALDGQGTLIVTEACLLSEGRNPLLSKVEIEETLKIGLNVSTIIWIPHGIIGDETDEHVDNMCAFVRPGVVALAWCEEKDKLQYKSCQQAFKILSKAKDAQGNTLQVIKVKMPEPIYATKDDIKGIDRHSKYKAKPRLEGDRLSASYINFYQGSDFVIIPGFGVKEDEQALKKFKEIYQDKKVIQIITKEILLGGGNIHCVTMQMPKVEDNNEN